MEHNVTQCRHFLTVKGAIFAGLDDTHRALEPQPGVKTAGWIIGHLATSGDFARRLCGRPPICPVDWRALFNPGTQPSLRPSDYPPMRDLCEAFDRVYQDLADSVATVDPKLLAVENPFTPARASFPTSGAFVAYLISGHLGYHLGQLVAWRSAAGLERLRMPDNVVA